MGVDPIAALKRAIRKLKFSETAHTFVLDVINHGPVRLPQGSPTTVTGLFLSEHLMRHLPYESRTLEAANLLVLRNDRAVVFYEVQPHTFVMVVDTPDGKRTSTWTPDVLVVMAKGRPILVEVKPKAWLEWQSEANPWKVARLKKGGFRCPAFEKAAADVGCDFKLVTEDDLPAALQVNLGFLGDYRNDHTVTGAQRVPLNKLISRIDHAGPIRLSEAVQDFDVQPETIYRALVNGTLKSDLSLWTITNTDSFWLCRSPQHLDALRVVTLNDSGELNDAWCAKAQVRDDALEIILRQPPSALERAIRLFATLYPEALPQYERVKLTPRRISSLRKAAADSNERYGTPLIGLIPKYASRGNHNSRQHPPHRKLIERFIERFRTDPVISQSAIHRAYEIEARKRRWRPVCLATFVSKIRARLRPSEIADAKRGDRAKAAIAPFAHIIEYLDPPHGSRPWEIAHVDHTTLDIELVDFETGLNLGRPTLTVMMDAHTRRVLAYWLSFEAPSHATLVLLFRECVRRWGRLPDTVVVDRGPDLKSYTFAALCLRFRMSLRIRPKARPRYGALVERLFGKTNKQFVHELRGNTLSSRWIRGTSGSHQAKTVAVWPFDRFDRRLEEYFFTIYDQLSHPALGRAPAEFYEHRAWITGARPSRCITFDHAFYVASLPAYRREYTVRGAMRKGAQGVRVSEKGTVYVNRVEYICQVTKNLAGTRTELPVRYDPSYIGHVFIQHEGKWLRCVSSLHPSLHSLSLGEARRLSIRYGQRPGAHKARKTQNDLLLSSFLSKCKDEECGLVEHRRSAVMSRKTARTRPQRTPTRTSVPTKQSSRPVFEASRAPRALA